MRPAFLVFATLLVSTASAQVDPEAVWPRQVGNVWMYADEVEPGVVIRWEITGEVAGTVIVDGQPALRTLSLLSENGGEPCAIREDVDGTDVVFSLVQPGNFEAPCSYHRFFPGQFHTVGEDTVPMRVGEWAEPRTVQVGEEEVVGRVAGGYADAGSTGFYYEDLFGLLEGVGLYEFWRFHDANGQPNETLYSYRLEYASVDGVVYGTPVASEEAPEASARLLVSPNPARDVVTVSGTSAGPVSLEVIDVRGRVVHHEEATLPASLDVRGLAPGVYAVVATGGEKRVRTRFVVVR